MNKSPILHRPTDTGLLMRLISIRDSAKLKVEGKGHPWEGLKPEIAHTRYQDYRDTFCLHGILACLLDPENRYVRRYNVMLHMRNGLGGNFNLEAFETAYDQVAFYLGDDSLVRVPTGGGHPLTNDLIVQIA